MTHPTDTELDGYLAAVLESQHPNTHRALCILAARVRVLEAARPKEVVRPKSGCRNGPNVPRRRDEADFADPPLPDDIDLAAMRKAAQAALADDVFGNEIDYEIQAGHTAAWEPKNAIEVLDRLDEATALAAKRLRLIDEGVVLYEAGERERNSLRARLETAEREAGRALVDGLPAAKSRDAAVAATHTLASQCGVLLRERDHWKTAYEGVRSQAKRDRDEAEDYGNKQLDAATAEIARLREALGTIVGIVEAMQPQVPGSRPVERREKSLSFCLNIARAALEKP